MTNKMKAFIRDNRKEIDKVIDSRWRLNDDEREEWIMNDEGLYNWARSEGVNP